MYKATIFDMHQVAFVKAYIKLGYNVTNLIRVTESVGIIKKHTATKNSYWHIVF